MEAYTSFAEVYDTFMDNVPYDEWGEYLVSLLKKYGVEDGLVLEMGCGTGAMTRYLDAHGYDMTGIDVSEEMLTIAKEKLGLADLRAIDADVTAAEKMADGMTAWRIEGTLREFARFDPVNLWFDYPVHKLDTGLLEDLQPDGDVKGFAARGAEKRWGSREKLAKNKSVELSTAYESCTMDGKVTVYAMAEYMGLKPDTVRRRLKADGGYWVDGADVGRKEPGSNG